MTAFSLFGKATATLFRTTVKLFRYSRGNVPPGAGVGFQKGLKWRDAEVMADSCEHEANLSSDTWPFSETFPTPEKLEAAGKRKWEKFLHADKLWRSDTVLKRLEIFARAAAFRGSSGQTAAKSLLALSCACVLQTLECQLLTYRAAIEAPFTQHPDSDLFGSLPGAGPKLVPRLLAEIGVKQTHSEG
jgi:hypothetical protein